MMGHKMRRLKYLCAIKTGGTPSGNEGINYDSDGLPWYTPADFSPTLMLTSAERWIDSQIIKKDKIRVFPQGSVYLVGIGATVGKIGYCEQEAYSNQQVTALIPFDIASKFLLYSLHAKASYIKDNALYTTLPIINNSYISNLMVNLPTLSEQKAIADFLDVGCSKIDSIIADKEKQIEILKSYKKRVIFHAVTKGLDGRVELKDSNVDWIGRIPKHWSKNKIKYIATLKGRIGWQGLTSEEYRSEGAYLITGTDFIDGKVNWKTCVCVDIKRWIEARDIQVKNGDLLITKDGTVGKLAIVDGLTSEASLNSGVLRITLNKENDTKFLYWVLGSNVFWGWFSDQNAGNSTIVHLYQNDFNNFAYMIPPLEEQQAIADHLDTECARIDAIIKEKLAAVETMKSYKKSLIYEYVTGKRRIQEAQ